jgi:tetratricopeptide (TPR) repeat protein
MSPIGERYLYLPSVGFTVLLALFLSKINRLPLFVVIVALFVGSYSLLTYDRLKVWESDLTLWEDTSRKNPLSATAHTNYGRALIEQQDYTTAQHELHLALKQKTSPEQKSNIYDLLGNMAMRQKRYEQAEKYFKKSLQSDTKNLSAMNNLGVLYLRMSENEKDNSEQQKLLAKAVTTFENILAVSPNFIQPKFNLGLALLAQKKYDKAEEYFNAVIENDPRGDFASKAMQFLLVIEFGKNKTER